MKTKNNKITDISAELDTLYGKDGSPEREQFRREAYAYCMGRRTCPTYRRKQVLHIKN